MLETESKLYLFMGTYCRALMDDIADERMADQPYDGANPPGWILGHLSICTDYAARLVGEGSQCPKRWHVMFAPGSTPPQDRSKYPSKDELMAAYEDGHQRVLAAVQNASAEMLDAPHEVEFLRETPLETARDLLAHLMTTHEATHLGQLSAWCRQMGIGEAFPNPRKN